jgi:hypothetical protein
VPGIGQEVSASVAQHVRMCIRQARPFAGAANCGKLANVVCKDNESVNEKNLSVIKAPQQERQVHRVSAVWTEGRSAARAFDLSDGGSVMRSAARASF